MMINIGSAAQTQPMSVFAMKVKWRTSSIVAARNGTYSHTHPQMNTSTHRHLSMCTREATNSDRLLVYTNNQHVMYPPKTAPNRLLYSVFSALINQDSELKKLSGYWAVQTMRGKWHWGFHGNCCKLLRGLLWKHMSDLTGMFTVSLATDSPCSLSHCLA